MPSPAYGHSGSWRDSVSQRTIGGVFQCRAIVPNGSPTTRKRRRLTALRLFCLTGCGGFKLRSIGDNRSTISTRSGAVLQCRAIVPNGSPTTRKRRRLAAVRLFYLTVCGGFRFRSIGYNRSTICTQRTKSRCRAQRPGAPTGRRPIPRVMKNSERTFN